MSVEISSILLSLGLGLGEPTHKPKIFNVRVWWRKGKLIGFGGGIICPEGHKIRQATPVKKL
jgi:hypothetical protein